MSRPESRPPEKVPAPDETAVVVGRIAGSYGLRGWLRVEPFNDPHESVLLTARVWHVRRPAIAGEASRAVPRPVAAVQASKAMQPPLPACFEVIRCKVQGAVLVAAVKGIEVKEVADSLRGCELAVSRSEFPDTDENEFYWVDLIGCDVVTPDGVVLGVVEALDDHGAHPLLRVRSQDGRERLIPFVSAHVPEVDIAARRIVADWDPEF